MLVNLAAQQPFPNIMRSHFSCDKSGWEEADHVGSVASDGQGLSVEEGSMDVHLIAHSKEMPRYMIPSAHGHHGKITKHITINGCRNKRRDGK